MWLCNDDDDDDDGKSAFIWPAFFTDDVCSVCVCFRYTLLFVFSTTHFKNKFDSVHLGMCH